METVNICNLYIGVNQPPPSNFFIFFWIGRLVELNNFPTQSKLLNYVENCEQDRSICGDVNLSPKTAEKLVNFEENKIKNSSEHKTKAFSFILCSTELRNFDNFEINLKKLNEPTYLMLLLDLWRIKKILSQLFKTIGHFGILAPSCVGNDLCRSSRRQTYTQCYTEARITQKPNIFFFIYRVSTNFWN